MAFLSRFWKFFTRRPFSRQSAPNEALVSRAAVERLVGQPIGDLGLYEEALRHRSVLRNGPIIVHDLPSNERLEFLGDAVLGLVVAEKLFTEYSEKDEGFLTRTRSKLVNGRILAKYAKRIGLGPLVLMSENMAQSDGRNNQTILADAFEAIIGAIYLDLGYQVVSDFILKVIEQTVELDTLVQQQNNYKSVLLEYVQARGWEQPQYQIVVEHGPSHKRQFTVDVLVEKEAMGRGQAGSKKLAEQKAAAQAVYKLQDR